MGSTFNPQILVEKLAKLNSSQQSIGTLSHWCIFHMNKAKQVVETWDRQFHCSPRDQRLAYLYLANDILQNSRRKGAEYVGEFWRFLPAALRDVIESGDEAGKNAALRLINIWDERKVFGSRGQILKDEFVGRHLDNGSRDGKLVGCKLRHSSGNTVDRIVSSFQVLYGGQLDEDAALNKCRDAMRYIEKVDKEIMPELGSGHLDGIDFLDELKGQHALLSDCIQQLTTVESSRRNLVNILREALHEQELKMDQVHNQLQAAHVLSEQAENMCRELLISNKNGQILPDEQIRKENKVQQGAHDFMPENKEQVGPVMYSRQFPFAGNSDHDPKASAAAVAAKLSASSSSQQMLTYVLSSLASEGVIGNHLKESSSGEYPSEKRLKIENEHPSYVPCENSSGNPTSSLDVNSFERPPPPSSPPPAPPLPPMQPYPSIPQYIPAAVTSMGDGSYGYSGAVPDYSTVASYSGLGNAASYQGYNGEGVFYSQQQQSSSLPMAPVSRQ